MSDKPPVAKKKLGKKPIRKSGTSSPKTPKSHKSSERSSPRLPDTEPPPKPFASPSLCQIHKKDLKFYCDSREELICEDCASNPMYSRYPSCVVTIEEAFRVRLSGLYNTLTNCIMPKRLQIDSQKYRVGSFLSLVKARKAEIERDMKGEFSAMNERLNFSYGTKQAVLQHDLKELQVDFDRMQHIIALVESSANDQVAFLQRSADLRSLIEMTASKPLRAMAEVRADDLPTELTRVREIASDYCAVQNLARVKDELIWKLLQDSARPTGVDEASQRELAEWARLAEKYTQELRRLQISCEYCNCLMSEETVNTNCPKNIRGEARGTSTRLQGTGRHYFTDEPRKSLRSFSPATKDSEVPIRDIARIVAQRAVPLQGLFVQQDPGREGRVKSKEFSEVVGNALELTKGQATDLAGKFDKKRKGVVEYRKFVRCVNEEIMKEGLGGMLDALRAGDEELHGVVSQEGFIEILRGIGVVVEDLSVFKGIELDGNGNVEYLRFITDFRKRTRS